jgi:hypothetical protein
MMIHSAICIKHRAFFDRAAELLNVHKVEDWYRVTRSDIAEIDNGNAVSSFGHIYQALRDIYPFTEWQPWRFAHIPKGFWDSKENQMLYFNYLEDKLEIYQSKDWYKIHIESWWFFFFGIIRSLCNWNVRKVLS